jgi:hypothetical protein
MHKLREPDCLLHILAAERRNAVAQIFCHKPFVLALGAKVQIGRNRVLN